MGWIMRVFDKIRLLVPDLEPTATKVAPRKLERLHDLLDQFLLEYFPEWQCFQAQRNFERPFVLTLIRMRQRDRWLFGGVHHVAGPAIRVQDPVKPQDECWRYPMHEEPSSTDITGRLVEQFTRTGRQ